MKRTFLRALLLSLPLSLATAELLPQLVRAESTPRAVKQDPRIRTVTFQQDNIIALFGMMGVSTMIEFNSDERIATVTMGDTVAWQAVPDQTRQFLFVKPLRVNAVTNMNVVTNRRIYNFMLHGDAAGDTRRAVIKLRFIYPDDIADAKLLAKAKDMITDPNLRTAMADTNRLNYAYGYKGNPENKPTSIFDDGVHTYFQFSSTTDSPAIFAVKSDNSETLVNYHKEGGYVVVDKVSKQWTLRNGDVTICIFNQKALENGL